MAETVLMMEERELKDSSTAAEAGRGGAARIDKRFLQLAVSLLCSESVSALYHSFTVVEVITWIMMAYLIDVGGLDVTHAARVISLWSGLAPLLTIVFLFLATNFTGNFSFVLLGLIGNTTGLVIITFAATTTKTTHTYVGLVFLLIGLACRELSYAFVTDLQLDHSDQELISIKEEGQRGHKVETGASLTKMAIMFLLFLLCFDGVAVKFCWFYRFVLGAVLMAAITLLVVAVGTWTYRRFDEPLLREGTTRAAGVLPDGFAVECGIPAVMSYGCPNDASDRGSSNNVCQRLLSEPPPRLSCCIEEGTSISFDTRWTACKVTELLGETKGIPYVVPTCIALLVSGLVSCLGETYFIAQALHTDSKLGSLNLSIYILFAFQKAAEFLFVRFLRKQNPTKGTILGMVYSTLCCATAALVEARRVHTPNDEEQSLFWLVPQFVLLGGFKGVFENNIGRLIQQEEEVNKGAHIIITSLGKGVQGLGKVGSILLVYVVGKLGETYREVYWFEDTSSSSMGRLDLYYWVLALLSAFAYVLLLDNLL